MNKKCPACGKLFNPGNRKEQIYCCRACYFEDHRTNNRICKHCGKEFHSSFERQIYCGLPCFNLHKTKPKPLCIQCGKPIKKPHKDAKFCSRKCMVEYRKPEPITCEICGVSFSPLKGGNGDYEKKRHTCSDACNAERQAKISANVARTRRQVTGPTHHKWKGGTSVYWGRGNGWDRIAEKARDRDSRICQHCGKTEEENGRRLDVHHIVPFHDINNVAKANKMGNLISLCQSCHQIAESKIRNKQIILPFASITQAKRRAARASAQA